MFELGARSRHQAPPPHVVFAALTQPHDARARPWLTLLEDEQEPQVLETHEPDLVIWSSLWPRRPDARIRFELQAPDGRAGTTLRWLLLVEQPRPDDSLTGHLLKRVNELINRDLRYSFGH